MKLTGIYSAAVWRGIFGIRMSIAGQNGGDSSTNIIRNVRRSWRIVKNENRP